MEYLHKYEAYSVDGQVVLLQAQCPGCGLPHHFRINSEYWTREGKDCWVFNGDYEKPTFDGSMLSHNDNYTRVCHSYLENGLWRFLKDSTHKISGMKNIPMVPTKYCPCYTGE